MDTISNSFEIVNVTGDSYSSSTKTISINIIDKSVRSNWNDEVGNSFEKTTNSILKDFNNAIKDNFDNLVKLDKSISLDAFSVDFYSIEQKIRNMTVK